MDVQEEDSAKATQPVDATAPVEPFVIHPYLEEMADYLEANEPDVWAWFTSEEKRQQSLDAIRLELLKSAYRLDREDHEALYTLSDEVAACLGCADASVTLYQSQVHNERNAALAFVPGELHILFCGDLLDVLTPEERRAVLAHEIAHYVVWTIRGGRFFLTEQILQHTVATNGASPSHLHSVLRYRRFLELTADQGSMAACEHDRDAVVAALVKSQTGLKAVSGASYLKQAREIFEQHQHGEEDVATEELTHPEAFIRAYALLENDGGDPAIVQRAVEGTFKLETLDLLGQARLRDRTLDLIGAILAPEWMRTEATLAHAKLFDNSFTLPAKPVSFTLADDDPDSEAWRHYLVWLLLDFASCDRSLGDRALQYTLQLAASAGVEEAFITHANKELKRTKRDLRKFAKEAALSDETKEEIT